ncbi:MAG TPA: asparagine--tRNA ligase [Thiotrichaceae bacterium]|jgi:asparaginyl-tRNA synthetase|nr:asparagine--tRNA ligase [Thiotrichaceae bacterium]HIM08988.1 asparagine--tRNA ligase [Gammaproteobacteria bacterium]
MTARTKLIELLKSEAAQESVLIKGWIRTQRESKDFSFIELNDGSCLANIQIIVDNDVDDYQEIVKLTTGAAISVTGELVESLGKGQKWEVRARAIGVLGVAPDDFPLQKKRHTDEYLRTIAHLRPRSNKYSAIFRMRSKLSFAVHQFFKERNFQWIHTPIITGSDCEGAGEMFSVTTMDLNNIPKKNGAVDYEQDFFGKEASLTVSGQLSVETFCLSLGDVYTFGPTFRSENSNTSRHMSEFWMIEPEMAFADIHDDMKLGQEFVQYLVKYTMEECTEDLELFAKFVDKNLMSTLENIVNNDFIRLSYTDAVDLLLKSNQKFEFPVKWGSDLQSEHERFLTEKHFKQPVIVYDYPKDIKAFYMRINDDEKTVAAMDILVPAIGEIIGGSQREERYDVLRQRITGMGFDEADYWWYLDTRKYGTVPHAGFGLGFERLLMLVSGISNIRDVIPFPRTPKHLEF